MNLVIDIGNTQYKMCVFQENKMVYHTFLNDIDETSVSTIFSHYNIQRIIFSDTRGINTSALIEKFPNELPILELTHKTALPITIDYATPETLGKDRIAGAVAAAGLFPGQPCLIIDIGTAITFDFMSENATFLGGNISPGPETRFKSLHQFTGKLPKVTFANDLQFLGNSTETAIQFGVQNGILYEINGYISRLKAEHDSLNVIITGGYALMFDRKINYPIFADSFLVPSGLNRILNYNA